MSRIQELIKEKCPNGVEYKNLDRICKILKGKQLNKESLLKEGLYPVINGGITPSGYWNEYNHKKDLITISQGGASAGFVAYQLTNFWAGAHCYIVEKCDKEINYKFLYHFLKKNQKTLQKSQEGAGIPSVSLKDIYKLKIPVPPLEVQEEIVRILDKFGELEAELEAELEVRKQQYEFWRNHIWNRTCNYNLFKLSSLCYIGDGLHGTPEYSENGNYYFINGNNLNNGIITYDKKTKKITNESYDKIKIDFGHNVVMMSINGTIGKVSLYNGEKVALGKSIAYFDIIDNSKLNKKYLFYLLQSKKAVDYFNNSLTGTTIKNLGLNALRNFKISLPSIEEQKNIVSMLDKFNKLINDISSGLPAEVELRKKQYEYYRNKLLSFEEIGHGNIA